jgi:hypothetical protein
MSRKAITLLVLVVYQRQFALSHPPPVHGLPPLAPLPTPGPPSPPPADAHPNEGMGMPDKAR